MLRREGDETTVQRRAGKPAVDNVSLVTVRFIRTSTRGSSSRPGERFSTKRWDTFTQTRCFAQLQTSCSQAADHTLSTNWPACTNNEGALLPTGGGMICASRLKGVLPVCNATLVLREFRSVFRQLVRFHIHHMNISK